MIRDWDFIENYFQRILQYFLFYREYLLLAIIATALLIFFMLLPFAVPHVHSCTRTWLCFFPSTQSSISDIVSGVFFSSLSLFCTLFTGHSLCLVLCPSRFCAPGHLDPMQLLSHRAFPGTWGHLSITPGGKGNLWGLNMNPACPWWLWLPWGPGLSPVAPSAGLGQLPGALGCPGSTAQLGMESRASSTWCLRF